LNPSSISVTSARPVSYFAASFLQPPATPDDQTLDAQGDQRISYSKALDGEISVFERSDKFKSYKEEFISELNFLGNFAERYHDSKAVVEEVREAFKTLEQRLFYSSPDFYGKHKKVLYEDGKRALDQLIALLGNEALTVECRLDTVVELAKNVKRCAERAATTLKGAAINLNLILCGNEIYSLKEEVLRALIREYAEETYPEERLMGMEIHFVNLISNELADEFGLPTYTDDFVDWCDVKPEEIADCRNYILERMTPALLAAALADKCLSQLDVTMQDHFATLQKESLAAALLPQTLGDASEAAKQEEDTSASFAYEKFEHVLKKALIRINERCGDDVDIFRFISPLDDDYERYSINKDATLIALEILQSLSKRKLTEDYFPKELIGYIGDGGTIEHYGAQLIWATESALETENGIQTEKFIPVLFTVEHLQSLFPHKLEESVARLAVATAIKNSSPAMLLESLSSDWLEKAGTSQWVAKMDGETFLPFIKKHETTIQKLSLRDRFHVARGIVASGSVSAFKAYIADNPDLTEASEKGLLTLVTFWNVTAVNKDSDMLDAVVNLVLETIVRLRSEPVSFMAAMARGLHSNVSWAGSTKGMCITASFHIVDILKELCGKGYIKPFQFTELFACKDKAQRPGLSSAMDSGDSTKVSVFGNVWLHAASKGVLSSKQLFKLLEAVHGGHSALFLALQKKDVATITAFGVIVVSAYSMGFLDSKQAAALMAYKEDYPSRKAFGNDVIEAYGQILQDIDAIKARAMK
jgi:hypothetical protein